MCSAWPIRPAPPRCPARQPGHRRREQCAVIDRATTAWSSRPQPGAHGAASARWWAARPATAGLGRGRQRQRLGGAPEERRCQQARAGAARAFATPRRRWRRRAWAWRATAAPAAAVAQPGATGMAAARRAVDLAGDGRAGPSTGGFIQADPSTNSLIITAAEPLYRQVRAMIDQLDSRRAQVYIESMIVEISGDNAADFGLQWQACWATAATSTACSPAPATRWAAPPSSRCRRPAPARAARCRATASTSR